MFTSEVLASSADLIEVAGLYQKGSGHGGKCIVTAIEEFEPVSSGFHRACDAVRGYLGVESCGEVIAWNDAPGRTQAEVVSMLRSVADIERQAEAFIASLDAVQVVTL